MAVILLLCIWVLPSFLLAFIFKDKNLGFWGIFFISILFSPLIGLLAGLISGTEPKTKIQYLEDIQKAEMAQNRSDYQTAISHYKDSLYRIERLAPAKDRHRDKFRKDKIIEIKNKITELEGLAG